MNMFQINEQKRYIIYGIGGNGIKIQRVLREANYLIDCFIDLRADSVRSVSGERVLNPEEAEKEIKDKKNCIVIITIKDVFDHSKIAKRLAKAGFVNCIYKPLEILQGIEDNELLDISKAHDRLIADLAIPDKLNLQETNCKICINLQERLLIEKNRTQVSAWLPVELLFNYHNGEPYESINMALFSPLVELYRYFMGEFKDFKKCDTAIENFILYSMEWMEKNHISDTEDLRKSLINSKYKAFIEMQRIVETDQNFFVRNAPEVFFEEGRFFISSSGRNRIAFLIAKGYRFVPVKMQTENYEKWKNQLVVNEITKFIQDNEVENLLMPVPNPLLSSLRENCTDYVSLFVMNCLNQITKQLFKESRMKKNELSCMDLNMFYAKRASIQIECFLQDEGWFGRIARLCDFRVADIQENPLNAMLDKLLYVKEKEERLPIERRIVVIDTVLMDKIQVTYEDVEQIFIICKDNNEEYINIFAKKGFKLMDTLFATMWNSERLAGYWLSR